VTPFKNGEVDFDAFSELVRRQLDAGIHFLVPLATTGETPCLENDEKLQLLVRCREIVDDYVLRTGRRVPIVAGAGTNSLRQTVRNMEFFSPHGADAFLVVVPYYNKPTQKGQYEYFKAVAGSTDKPVIIYNVPGRTGANMEAETCIRLAHDVPNIVGIKEASGRFSQIADILAGVPKSFSVLSGDDDITMPMMNAGATGVISVASNVVPELMVEFVEALGAPEVCGEGFISAPDMMKSSELFYRLRPFFSACFVESNPIPVKAALSLLGLIQNELRLPLVPCCGNTERLMKEVLENLGYLK
ncbi:MAG: 4-hydroxy-tetrahydrodipicolinate synthase, partial [Candidatus Cryptobacteroides sp.]